jgi:AmmeMemoRadiSam system protein A
MNNYTPVQQKRIQHIALSSIQLFLEKKIFLIPSDWKEDACLFDNRATFVTLKEYSSLRGCVGSIIPRKPLWKDVSENAINAAFYDPRFEPIQESDLTKISIEISILTQPILVKMESFLEFEKVIKPLVDGVIIQFGHHQATFLPQVWEELSDPKLFLKHLCLKAGLTKDFTKNRFQELSIFTYQAEIIKEEINN